MKLFQWILALTASAMLVACGGGGGSAGTNPNAPVSPTTPTTNTSTVASLALVSSLNQISADNANSATLVVTALDANNGLLANQNITLSASTGVLSSSSGVTDANGQATFQFRSGTLNQSNRDATITAASNGVTAQTVVRIVGGTLTLDSGSVNALTIGGATVNLKATLRDASGVIIPNVVVTFASSSGNVTLSTSTATTNASGEATIVVTGVSAGSAIVSATANGISTPIAFTVSAPGVGFYFLSPNSGAVITTGAPQALSVQAGTATNVIFVTNLGTFSNGLNNQTVPVVAGQASAVITIPSAGQAAITAFNSSATSISASLAITASPPVSSANKLLLTANRTNAPISSSTTKNTIQVKARAIFNSGGVDASVFNVPVLFTMSGGPGAGEYLSSAIVFTNASGEAVTDFVSGSQSSTQNGITIRAQILGTAVATGAAPSGNDWVVTVGGQALSVAFSPSTQIRSSADGTYYEFDFSALVSDANGAAVGNQNVSLSVKPYAFTTGLNACAASLTNTFTFCSEDRNGNGSLDSGEDGIRIDLPFDLNPVACSAGPLFGTSNGQLTPPNSYAGTVPNNIVTLANGVAPFTLTYLKSSAVWVVVELTATVNSAGTEAKSSSIFRLPPSSDDASDAENCPLPSSPFSQ